MLATITCKTREDSNYVYDLLVSRIRGNDSLIGSKRCVDSFEQVDDVMVFDLTEKEVEDLKKLPQVLNVTTNDVQEISFYNITKKNITGYPKLATLNPPNNELLSHSLMYCQDYSLKYIQLMCQFNKLSSDIKMGFSTNMPMTMKYDLGEESCVMFHLAPKLTDD